MAFDEQRLSGRARWHLTRAEWFVLRTLAERRSDMTVPEIVRLAGSVSSVPSVYRAVAALMGRGLLRKVRPARMTGRTRVVEISEEGARLARARQTLRDPRHHAATTRQRAASANSRRGPTRASPLQLLCLEALPPVDDERYARDARWVARRSEGWIEVASARTMLARLEAKGVVRGWSDKREEGAAGGRRRPRRYTVRPLGSEMLRWAYLKDGETEGRETENPEASNERATRASRSRSRAQRG